VTLVGAVFLLLVCGGSTSKFLSDGQLSYRLYTNLYKPTFEYFDANRAEMPIVEMWFIETTE
jgi:hypothetical protein